MLVMKDRELLKAVLGNIDLSQLPEVVQAEANAFIANVGGCAFCGRLATRLCDYVLGFSIAGWSECTLPTAFKVGRLDEYVAGKGLPCTDLNSECYTCDAPICESCRVEVGMWTCSGVPEAIDHCPAHATARMPPGVCITAEGAESARRRVWKHPFSVVGGE